MATERKQSAEAFNKPANSNDAKDKLAAEAFAFPQEIIVKYVFDKPISTDLRKKIERLYSTNSIFRTRLDGCRSFIRNENISSIENYFLISEKLTEELTTSFFDKIKNVDKRKKSALENEKNGNDVDSPSVDRFNQEISTKDKKTQIAHPIKLEIINYNGSNYVLFSADKLKVRKPIHILDVYKNEKLKKKIGTAFKTEDGLLIHVIIHGTAKSLKTISSEIEDRFKELTINGQIDELKSKKLMTYIRRILTGMETVFLQPQRSKNRIAN